MPWQLDVYLELALLALRKINLLLRHPRTTSFSRECWRQSRLADASGNETLAAASDVAGWTA